MLKCNCFIGTIVRSYDEEKRSLTVTKSVSVVPMSGQFLSVRVSVKRQ